MCVSLNESVCVYVGVCVRTRVRACVCVCVCFSHNISPFVSRFQVCFNIWLNESLWLYYFWNKTMCAYHCVWMFEWAYDLVTEVYMIYVYVYDSFKAIGYRGITTWPIETTEWSCTECDWSDDASVRRRHPPVLQSCECKKHTVVITVSHTPGILWCRVLWQIHFKFINKSVIYLHVHRVLSLIRGLI